MKKTLFVLFIGFISIILIPFNVSAKSISTLDVTDSNNKLTVSGTTENGVLAVAVMVYSGEDLSHMETCSCNNNKYSCELSKTFAAGNYIVKVADYDGGDYITKNVVISTTVNNPKTGDNIMKYIIVGGLCALGIVGCTLFLKKRIVIINK